MKSDLPYLAHIADSINAIETYVAGGREISMSQRMVQDAVIRNFEIIGEAAGKLSAPARGSSERTWRWNVIENDLTPLKAEVDRLIAEHP